ncbi:tetratricopeptide repeat protein [Teredinibacter waterburyi]|jgi:Tfp pilus assembly protein PilF|uniref:tetratricopeptide repeat protein n=1 Tax=Teredinibacter waterburyi TaxID=1500538 RepID=UPI00165F848A|nr:tetratricopeptide repeat protein [Teredinibacter waterburyi]
MNYSTRFPGSQTTAKRIRSQYASASLLAVSLILAPLASWATSHSASDTPSDVSSTLAVENNTAVIDLNQLPAIEDAELVTLSDDVKAMLDRTLGDISNSWTLSLKLHQLLFNDELLGIDYDGGATKTAMETLRSGSGNCLSLASLYVAAARHLGLKAEFQVVKIPPEWLQRPDFYIVPGHVNVLVRLPGDDAIVEFADAYSAEQTKTFKSKVISDRQAFAEYYNNRGMEKLQEHDYPTALAFLNKSLEAYPKLGFVWSNIGVIYRITGHPELALGAYEKAFMLDAKNLSVANNLYIAYRKAGAEQKAEKLAKRIARHHRKNPFALTKLAQSQLNAGNFRDAEKLLTKAIKINPTVPQFHHLLAVTYYKQGEFDKSEESMQNAVDAAELNTEKNQYQRKLDMLKHIHAGL